MLSIAKKILKSLDKNKYIVNIGVTPDGIGKVYALAKELGFETYGIVSIKAEKYLSSVNYVDVAFLVQDETWGGYMPDGKLSPTSEAMVSVSDRVVGIGGGDVGHDELLESIKRNLTVNVFKAEMNHAKAIAKALKNGLPEPTQFYGKANDLATLK
jgi:hypothetical protein